MMTCDRWFVVAVNNAAVEVHPNCYMAGKRAEVVASDNQANCKHPGHRVLDAARRMYTAGMWTGVSTTEIHVDETNSEVKLVVE